VGHARGEVELEGKVLVLKRIHVTYIGLDLTDVDRDALQRVVATHAHGCPVARSIQPAIEVTTELVGL